MIWLTRLNGNKFVLNSDLIKSMESTPDTVITLTEGEKFMVKEPVDTIIQLTIEYRRKLYRDGPQRVESQKIDKVG